jgi:hypothetical protein
MLFSYVVGGGNVVTFLNTNLGFDAHLMPMRSSLSVIDREILV